MPSIRATTSPRRRAAWVALQLAVTAAALAWTLTRAPLAELGAALGRVRAAPLALAVGLCLLHLAVAAARWRFVLRACGVAISPSLFSLFRLHLVGLFYNLALPGSVAGDLVRAHATRQTAGSLVAAYYVVAFDRALGLSAMLVLAACGVLATGAVRAPALLAGVLVALVLAIALGLAPIGAHRVAPRLPERIGSSLRALPRVTRPLSMGLAACTALAAQGLVAAMGWLLVTELAPAANGVLVFALVPVGLAAAHLPVAIAGLGVREAAFVALLPSAGVAPPEAAAGSLALLGAQLVTAAFGGLVQWVQPARRAPDS